MKRDKDIIAGSGPDHVRGARVMERAKGRATLARVPLRVAALAVNLSAFLAVAVPGPAVAQSLPVRAAAEIRMAMQNCLTHYQEPQRIFAGFTQNGYFYSKEDFGGGPADVIHWFNRPDRLIEVAVIFGPIHSECRISTGHIAVPMALKFTRAVLRSIYQGDVFDGSPENQNIVPGHPQARQEPCSGYSFLVPGRQVWIPVGTAGQDPLCINDGTSQIMMRM